MSITDWDERMLCPDGGCVGVIGADGTCKTCGRAAPNWGDERRRGLKSTGEIATKAAKKVATSIPPEHTATAADPDDLDDGEDDEDDDDEDDDAGEDGDADFDDGDDEDDDEDAGEGDEDGVVHARAAGSSGGEWDQRALCPNGACVGVLGADGACKTCGARA